VLAIVGNYCSLIKFFYQIGEAVGNSIWTILANWLTKIAYILGYFGESTKNVLTIVWLILNFLFTPIQTALHIILNCYEAM
jgi:hypothetical protein